MSGARSGAIRQIFNAAVEAVKPATVVRKHVRYDGTGITVGEQHYPLDGRDLYIIAIGKAAAGMTAELEAIAGDRIAGGIAVVKELDHALRLDSTVVQGAHPVPDDRSLESGEQVLGFASAIPEGSLVVCLISGGGSALVESLRPGVDLPELQRITRALLESGATINELNAVRSRLSRIKAGGLLDALSHTEVVNLVLSDVLGDDLATIASGPTVPRALQEPAEAVLERYNVEASLLEAQEQRDQPPPHTIVGGNLSMAIDAAASEAERLGFEPIILSRSLAGEARHVATTFAAVLADTAGGETSFSPGTCILAGGETTVTIRGNGKGGRNTESALAAAIRLAGVDGVTAGFLATDGDDAETGVAGGIVTGDTIAMDDLPLAREALARNDSFTFLEARDAAWKTGQTGTNVNDLLIGIVG